MTVSERTYQIIQTVGPYIVVISTVVGLVGLFM
jgi:hypothetical protein